MHIPALPPKSLIGRSSLRECSPVTTSGPECLENTLEGIDYGLSTKLTLWKKKIEPKLHYPSVSQPFDSYIWGPAAFESSGSMGSKGHFFHVIIPSLTLICKIPTGVMLAGSDPPVSWCNWPDLLSLTSVGDSVSERVCVSLSTWRLLASVQIKFLLYSKTVKWQERIGSSSGAWTVLR